MTDNKVDESSKVDYTDQETIFDEIDVEATYERTIGLTLFLEYKLDFAFSLLPKEGLFLDIGCAHGEVMRNLSFKAAKVVGVDISSKQVELAKQQDYACPMECYHANILDFECDERFDLITALEVIEHLIEPDKLLSKVKSMLKPDGRAMITTPNWNSIDRRFRRFFPVRTLVKAIGGPDWSKPWWAHVKEFTMPEIVDMVAEAGMVVEEVRGLNVIPLYLELGRFVRNRRLMKGLLSVSHSSPQWCEDIIYVMKKA
jgi:2-polyprenyl-3-methyl-5-hydroxy-6-metoxy-1,4-benzoquinol methylase